MQTWLLCLLLLVAQGSGIVFAQEEKGKRERVKMETDWKENKADFATLFRSAVHQSGAQYLQTRHALLSLGERALPLLQARQQAADWQERLTADTLLGWLTHKEKFDQCDLYIRGEFAEPTNNILGKYTVEERSKAIAKLGKEVTPHLLEIVMKTREYQDMDEDGYQEASVFGALLILKDPRSAEPMLALARATDQEARLRGAAASVLGRLNEPRAVETLLHVFTDTKEPYALRATVARNLGVLRATAAFPFLIKAFQDASEARDVRIAAAEVIGMMGDAKSSPFLTKALPQISNLALMGTVIGALSRIGDHSSLGALRKVEQTHSEEDICIAARDARAKIVERLRRNRHAPGGGANPLDATELL